MAPDRFVVTNLAINPATHRGNLDGRTKTSEVPVVVSQRGANRTRAGEGAQPARQTPASEGALFADTPTAHNTTLTLYKHHIDGSFDPHSGQKRGGQTTMYGPDYGCTPCR